MNFQDIVNLLNRAAFTHWRQQSRWSLLRIPVKCIRLDAVKKAVSYMAWLRRELLESRRALVEAGLAHYDSEGNFVKDYEKETAS
jgi:hypothetical protein